MPFSSIKSPISFCLTHRRKIFPLFHSIDVLSLLFLSIYLVLALSATHLTSHSTGSTAEILTSSYTPFYPAYQPIPKASVCECLDTLSLPFFTKSYVFSIRWTSKKYVNFLFSLLLILAGDVELNPGPVSSSNLLAYCLNIRSASTITDTLNKPELIQQYIVDKQIDVLFLTESWLSPDTPPSVLNSLTPPDYSFQHIPRPSGRGGGIAAIFRSKFSATLVKSLSFPSFEHMLLRLTYASKSYLFLTVYRPPSMSKSSFISDFSSLLEDIASSPSDLVIMGDFNIHLDSPDEHYSSTFSSTLEAFDLKQHISSPTHASGHILDLLITRDKTPIIDYGVSEQSMSDHSAIFCRLPVPVNSLPSRTVKTYRKLSSIDTSAFSADILASSLYSNTSHTVASYSQQLSSVLLSILDKHAPLRSICCRSNPRKPFISDEILIQKKERSKLESIFRHDKKRNPLEKQNPIHKANYMKQCKLVDTMVSTAKSSYFRNMIKQNQNCPKKLWGTLDSLLGRSIPKSLPSSNSPSDLATSFLNFFDDKITKLCNAIPFCVNSTDTTIPSNLQKPPSLTNFVLASREEIRNFILSSTDSSCSLDVIPTKLLKSCIDALVDPITRLINLSLSEGVFPTSFKHAVVSPLLKKQSLPKDDLSSYRPISNLNFISKILEKVIYARLCSHLESFPSLSRFQSAYRKFHSAETALLRVHNDLIMAMEHKQVSALVLLDLSAAFDTIDHNILTNRLKTCFGISESAIALLSSYLSCRTQSVIIGQHCSSNMPLLRGVPQGSVLGPLLFTLYTTPLSHVLDDASIKFHFYADDTQLYISFSSSESDESLVKLSSVLDQVYSWFCSNRLSVNPSKTEYLLIGTPQQRAKITHSSVYFQNLVLIPSHNARNLGVIFDENLDFKKHISNTCSTAFFQIRQLRQIRSSLDKNSAILLGNSIVHSKLDYCNSLLYGLPASSTIRLQRVQNSLARAVCRSSRLMARSSSLLRELHWLPVSQRIKYKIALLTFKTLHFGKPSYLSELLSLYQPSRKLRSSDANLLAVPDIRTSLGRRSFSFAAPSIWNSLPPDLRSCTSISTFCSRLKTHLFPP